MTQKRFFSIFIIGIVAAIVLIGMAIILAPFYLHRYQSSPGFTSEEIAREWYKHSPKCRGKSILLNREATYADAPGDSLCIGILSAPNTETP